VAGDFLFVALGHDPDPRSWPGMREDGAGVLDALAPVAERRVPARCRTRPPVELRSAAGRLRPAGRGAPGGGPARRLHAGPLDALKSGSKRPSRPPVQGLVNTETPWRTT
jgi:hypothetical protein